MKNKWVVMVIVVLVIAAASFWGYKMFLAKANKEVNFQTETVKRRDIASSVQATGVIRAKIGAEVKVGARISGKVEKRVGSQTLMPTSSLPSWRLCRNLPFALSLSKGEP